MPFSRGNESDDPTVFDRSKFGNDGVCNGVSTDYGCNWTTGFNGNAMFFDGTDDFINLSDDSSLDFGTGSFSIEAWIKTAVKGIEIISRTKSTSGTTWEMSLQGSSGAIFARLHDGTNVVIVTNDGTSLNDNVWHHITLVVDRDADEMRRYVDGKISGTVDDISSVTGSVDNLGESVLIGKRANPSANIPFNGTIDEVRFYKRALTTAEVTARYLATVNATLKPYTDIEGKVGINTTTPAQTLQVAGTFNVTAKTGTEPNLFVSRLGNVGIGTSTPNQKLVVVGDLNVTGTSYLGDMDFSGSTIKAGVINVTDNLTVGKNIDITHNNGSLFQPVYGTDDDLVLYLPFNGPNGSIQYDRGPYGNDGTLQGGINCDASQGKYGAACEFNSTTTDYISLPNSKSLNMTSDVSFTAWVNPRVSGLMNIVSGILSPSKHGALYYPAIDGNGFFTTYNGEWRDTTTVMQSDQWYHVALTQTGTTTRLYVNGVMESISTATALHSGGGRVEYIGIFRTLVVRKFNGTIDEVMIYKRALTAEEIRTHYLRGSGFGASGAITADKFRVVNTSGSKTLELNGTAFEIFDNSGADTFVVDKVNGRVGIGTASPGKALSIDGDLEFVGAQTINTTSGTLKIASNSEISLDPASGQINLVGKTGNGKIVIGSDGSVTFTNTNAAGDLTLTPAQTFKLGTSSTDSIEIGSSGITTTFEGAVVFNEGGNSVDFRVEGSGEPNALFVQGSDGNVGIGTITPATKLDVQGKLNVTGNTSIAYDTLFVDNTSGRVGIGTTSPTNALSISGDANIANGNGLIIGHTAQIDLDGIAELQILGTDITELDSSVIIGRWTEDNQQARLQFLKSRNSVIGSNTIVQNGDLVGSIGWHADDGTDYDNRVASIIVAIDGPPGTDDTPGRILFSTTADGTRTSTERMRIDSSGKVGINTTNPSATLKVNGTVNFTAQLREDTDFGVMPDGGIQMDNLLSTTGGTSVCILNGELLDSGSGTDCSASSLRFKENVMELDSGLDVVMKMNPISFNFKEEIYNDKSRRVGMIAEEVEKIDERLVNYDKENLPVSLRYNEYTAILTKAIQELKSEKDVEIELLKLEIQELNQELKQLKSE